MTDKTRRDILKGAAAAGLTGALVPVGKAEAEESSEEESGSEGEEEKEPEKKEEE